MTLPGPSEIGFSAKAFTAGMLALWIGFSLNLDRPYWALFVVFIVMQPISGAMRSRSLYYLAGTVSGAVVVLALAGLLANSLLALFLGVGFTGIGLIYLAALDRTPRRYAFQTGAIAVAIIGFPSAVAPLSAFTTAVVRMEEIALGIVCATVVDSIVFPHPVGPALDAQTKSWLEQAERRIADVLGGDRAGDGQGLVEFAAAATQMITLSTQVAYDTVARPPSSRTVRLLYKRMLTLLAVLSGVRDILSALREGGSEPPEVRRVLDAVRGWVAMAPDAPQEESERVRGGVAGLAPSAEKRGEWRAVLLISLRRVLTLLMDAWEDCRELQRLVATGDRPPARLARAAAHEVLLVPYSDKLRALFALLPVALAFVVVGAVWTATAWNAGLVAAEFTMIGYGVMSLQENPILGIRVYLFAVIGASLIELVYLFGVLPAVHGFPLLVLALGLVFLPIGAFIPVPTIGLPAMLLAALTASLLALQSTYSANFTSSVNTALGMVGGLLCALVIADVIGGPGVLFTTRRLLRARRADLAAIAAGRWRPEAEVYVLLSVDRTLQLAPRLQGDMIPESIRANDPLAETRVGVAMLRLWQNRPALPHRARAAIGRALNALSAHFSRPSVSPEPDLLRCIEAALDVLAAAPSSVPARDAVMALAGVRRALFPRATRIDQHAAAEAAAKWDRDDAA